MAQAKKGVLFGKSEFRRRQDMLKLPDKYSQISQHAFNASWNLGFKAAIDLLMVEFRGIEMHDTADILEKIKDQTWPT